MEFEKFIERLYECGWRAPNDAQHEQIKALWLEATQAVDFRLKFSIADERIRTVLRACKQAEKEGWQHLPIKTVVTLVTPPAEGA